MSETQETKMMRGAIWACILPMALGLFGLTFTLHIEPSFQTGRSFSDSLHFLTLPVVLCFILGTPLAAFSACLRLRQTISFEEWTSWQAAVGCALHSATRVHLWAAVIYTIIALLFFFPDGGTIEGGIIRMIFILIMSPLINLGLWGFLTLPLSLLCATIFHRVTKFPSNRTVF